MKSLLQMVANSTKGEFMMAYTGDIKNMLNKNGIGSFPLVKPVVDDSLIKEGVREMLGIEKWTQFKESYARSGVEKMERLNDWQREFVDLVKGHEEVRGIYLFNQYGEEYIHVFIEDFLNNMRIFSEIYVEFLRKNRDIWFEFLVFDRDDEVENIVPKDAIFIDCEGS